MDRLLIKLVFVLLTASACGKKTDPAPDTKSPAPLTGLQTETEAPQKKTSYDCKKTIISSRDKDADCFFVLKALKDGESFTAKYTYTKERQTKGITVGKGLWTCRKGIWYQTAYTFVCLNCLPEHDLLHCQNELERLIRKKAPGG